MRGTRRGTSAARQDDREHIAMERGREERGGEGEEFGDGGWWM